MVRALETYAKNLTGEEQKCVERCYEQLTESVLTNGGEAMKEPSENKMDRGYIDGCYDLCHSGHFNAIR